MDNMAGDLGAVPSGDDAREQRSSRGLLVALSTWVFLVAALALAPLAHAVLEESPTVTPVPGGFTWESQGFAKEWGYAVAVSRCSSPGVCGQTQEYKIERIPGVQSFVPYAQNITSFTPESTVWVGVSVLPERGGKHDSYRAERVGVPLEGESKTDRLPAPKELWAEGAVVNWSGIGEEAIPNLAYKVAVSTGPRFCSGSSCRDTHYFPVATEAGRSFTPCIGHLEFTPEPTTAYVGVAALKFKNQPGELVYTGSEVAVKLARCPPPKVATRVSSVTQSFAELEGEVDPLESKGVECRFEYATAAEHAATGKYTHKEACREWSQAEGPKAANVTLPLAELAPETSYDFRLVATAPNIGVGESQGNFSTLATPHPEPEKHPPVELAAPTLSGTPIAGYNYALTVTSGVWAHQPGYSYQWQRCDAVGNACANIVGATANSIQLTGSDIGHRLRAIVTATNGDGWAQAISQPSLVIGATVGSRAIWTWAQGRPSTRVVSLKVTGIPVGAALEVSCLGQRCPFHSKKIRLAPHRPRCRHRPCKRGSVGPRTQVTLAYPFGHGSFRPGTLLSARVTEVGWAARISQFAIRRKAGEEPAEVCLVPGTPRAVTCPRP